MERTSVKDEVVAGRTPRTSSDASVEFAEKVRSLVGEDATLAIARPDAAGRLRIVWRDGAPSGRHVGRGRHLRTAHTERRATVLPVARDRAVAIMPLVTRSTSLGVVQIEAASSALTGAWDLLLLLSEHLATTLRSIAEFERLRKEVQTLESASALGRRLVHAPNPTAAVEMVVRFFASTFRLPVAGWLAGPDGTLALVASGGLRASSCSALTLQTVAADAVATPEAGVDVVVDSFRAIVEPLETAVVEAGAAFVLVGRDPRSAVAGTIDEVGALLGEMLRLALVNASATARRQQLDMGLAWTAHELRGPLMGVRAVLESMDRVDEDPDRRAVMQSSVRELDQLVGTTEALLTWAAGTRTVDRQHEDLLQIVRDAIASNRLETGVDASITQAPADTSAQVDRRHIRTALANMLRNAAAHADPGTAIEVAIVQDEEHLIVRVTDQGPPIPAAERRAIFDPFVRGEISGRARNGSGLGLFITRRVAEAHGGAIWVNSADRRTTFSLALPAERRGEQRFAS